MSPLLSTSPQDDCHLLRLPRELRDRIYENLLSIEHTKTPKEVEAGLRSTTRYDWNIDPTILRVNHQISREAKELFGRNNKFVVIERTQVLEARESDMEEDPAIMSCNVKIWPGKKVKTADVPGEMMRVRLTKMGDQSEQSAELDINIVLVEELRDLCTCLSILLEEDGTYRTAGMLARVRFMDSASEDTPQKRDNTRVVLSQPLTQLRHFGDVEVEDMPHEKAMVLLSPLLSTTFDSVVVQATIHDLILSGDRARDIGCFDIATVYYQIADEYFHHCIDHGNSAFTQPEHIMAIQFKMMQHRALNWIESGDFQHANEAAEMALEMSETLFEALAADDPTAAHASAPWENAQGVVTKGALREWMCQCIKEGAEQSGQHIKAEDVGRVFFYKSIAEYAVGGNAAMKQAEEDKMMAIGCCTVSETIGQENVVKELLELDMKIIEGLESGKWALPLTDSEDEWEDEDDYDESEEGDAVD